MRLWRYNKKQDIAVVFLFLSLFLIGCTHPQKPLSTTTMRITSSAFNDNTVIPARFTCDGEDLSPPLAWSDLPEDTRSLALIMDDPDAVGGTWVHWVIYNIPATRSGLQEHLTADATFPDGSLHGTNTWDRLGYGGPCPPSGSHRYIFHLYALREHLAVGSGLTKEQLLQTMQPVLMTEATLTGKYR